MFMETNTIINKSQSKNKLLHILTAVNLLLSTLYLFHVPNEETEAERG